MLGELNNNEIEDLIRHQLIGRIGCCAEGIMYVVPISYAYDGTYIYAYTFEGMKLDIMRKNPQVCFEIDDTSNLSNWKSVIIRGEFEELKNEEDKQKGLQVLQERILPVIHSETMHISTLWPFSTDHPEEAIGIVFRIRPIQKTGRFERNNAHFFYAT